MAPPPPRQSRLDSARALEPGARANGRKGRQCPAGGRPRRPRRPPRLQRLDIARAMEPAPGDAWAPRSPSTLTQSGRPSAVTGPAPTLCW